MNELKYIESFSKEEIIEKMQNYLNEVEADIENPRSDADDEFVGSIKKEVWLVAIQLVKQIDEPQKVKMPAFVVEWIEYVKKKGDSFFDSFSPWDLYGAEYVEADEWIAKNGETYARAWLDGYEVEEEPKYIVPVPNLSKEFFYTADGQHISFCQRRNIDDVKSKVKFTLKEVERLFPELVDTVEKV
ncbi:DUF1642 domain-containing protein [Enterococcus gilvus]|uniref:DUF1642 domain-containing protein n=1 Tax=Enterococcus gilvus TaxID=160453 RepID=UPI003D6B1BC1